MSIFVAIFGTLAAETVKPEDLAAEWRARHGELPETYTTVYEQRDGDYELRPLELRTAEVSRDDQFRYLRTLLIAVPVGRPALVKFSSEDVRGAIDWDVKL